MNAAVYQDAVYQDASCQLVTCTSRQAIQIGEGIEIAILSIEGDQVRLGITAPGCRLRTIDPVPLPAGIPEFKLLGLEPEFRWSKG